MLTFNSKSLLEMDRNPFFKVVKDVAIGKAFDGSIIYEMVLKNRDQRTLWKGSYRSKLGKLSKARFHEAEEI